MIGRKGKGQQEQAAPAAAPVRAPKKRARGLGKMLAPALQAAVGTMAFVFLFAAVVPGAWLDALAWQLYLDQISPMLTPPLGMGARIIFAVTMALLCGLIAFMIMLALAKPPVEGRSVMTRRVAERARKLAESDEFVPVVRAADAHPDAPPRAPFRAERDLAEPASGESPRKAAWMDELAAENSVPAEDGDAPFELGADALYVEPAATAVPAADSLDALVARFEAGLARRRAAAAQPHMAAQTAVPAASNDQGEAAFELGAEHLLDADEPTVDLGLEAALNTLQRMSRRAVG
jgi:hypothetical protein